MRPFLTYAVAAAGCLAAAAVTLSPGAGAGARVSAATGAAVASGDVPVEPAARVIPLDAAMRALPPSQGRGDHAFYFTRGIYTSGGGWGGRRSNAWATDWDKADRQFLTVLRRLTNLDAYASDHVMRLDDPELRRHPFLYIVEVGSITLTPAEVTGLREYMLAGGFVFVDDFWGDPAWYNFERQMSIVLPEHRIVDLPLDHPFFRVFYEIRELQQMPSINHWRGGQTTECFGCEIALRGIFAEDGRLMMMIAWNTDNGDAWEWAEQPDIPLKFSTFAYQLGVNAVVYSMSH